MTRMHVKHDSTYHIKINVILNEMVNGFPFYFFRFVKHRNSQTCTFFYNSSLVRDTNLNSELLGLESVLKVDQLLLLLVKAKWEEIPFSSLGW